MAVGQISKVPLGPKDLHRAILKHDIAVAHAMTFLLTHLFRTIGQNIYYTSNAATTSWQ